MKATRFALGSLLFVAFFASDSMAQLQRTFVSGLGSDGNPCTRMAPCRTFGTAIGQTNPGGEVVVLDSAGYAAFAISKAISIIAPPGVYAGISVFSGNGIEINAGGTDTIILRGLTLNNQGGTGNGILFATGGTLHVESCVVNGFQTEAGISFEGPGNLEVKDSIMRGDSFGIFTAPSSGTATVAIDQVRLERCTFGLLAEEGSKVTVRNSIASANVQAGFQAFSQTSGAVELNIENCVASNNSQNGIVAQSNSTGIATVRVSNSVVTDNSISGISVTGPAVLLSRGNNTVEGNTTNTSGTIGSYTAK